MKCNRQQKDRNLLISKLKVARKKSANRIYEWEYYVALFKQKIREVPYYVYSVSLCNRLRYFASTTSNIFLLIQFHLMVKNTYV